MGGGRGGGGGELECNLSIVPEQIVITCFGTSDQFSYPVQEFMLRNDTLKNGTPRIGLYGKTN